MLTEKLRRLGNKLRIKQLNQLLNRLFYWSFKMPKLNKLDSDYQHIAVIRNRDDFIGGSFTYTYLDNEVWEVKGTLSETQMEDTLQRLEFSPTQYTIKQMEEYLETNKIEALKIIPASLDLKIDEAPKTPIDTVKTTTTNRVDWLLFPENEMERSDMDAYMYKKMEKNDEGFLVGRAVVTNVGVFAYKMSDGTIQYELRSPEEVFNENSLDTLKLKPITNGHPKDMVTAENVKKLQVGSLGDDIRKDAYRVSLPISINQADAVQAVNNGQQALSCGYSADVIEKTGVWMGISYTHIQTNIKYNHVALVEKGRAGDDAVLKMDSIDGEFPIGVQQKIQKLKKEDFNMPTLKKMDIDGVEYEAEAKVIENLIQSNKKCDSLSTELETLKKDHSTLDAEKDNLKVELDKAKADLAKALEEQPSKLDEAVKSRLELLDAAKKAEVEVKEDMSDSDIKKAVILKADPSAEAKLDGADDIYVTARFDAAVSILSKVENTSAENKEKLNPLPTDKKDSADDAYAKNVSSLENDWMNKE